jgi:small GTP-binding protein
VLLGNTAVGKTSIFNRIINDSYIQDGVSNTSAYYRSKVMDVPGTNERIKINLWDTAGQEKFFSLTKMYV